MGFNNLPNDILNMWICGIVSSLCYYFAVFSVQSNMVVLFTILLIVGTVGNLLAPGFVLGFKKQSLRVFKGKKLIPAIAIVVLMVLNIILAFTLKKEFLCLALCIAESIAFGFYAIFSIPGGQKVAKLTAQSLV